MHISVLDI